MVIRLCPPASETWVSFVRCITNYRLSGPYRVERWSFPKLKSMISQTKINFATEQYVMDSSLFAISILNERKIEIPLARFEMTDYQHATDFGTFSFTYAPSLVSATKINIEPTPNNIQSHTYHRFGTHTTNNARHPTDNADTHTFTHRSVEQKTNVILREEDASYLQMPCRFMRGPLQVFNVVDICSSSTE